MAAAGAPESLVTAAEEAISQLQGLADESTPGRR